MPRISYVTGEQGQKQENKQVHEKKLPLVCNGDAASVNEQKSEPDNKRERDEAISAKLCLSKCSIMPDLIVIHIGSKIIGSLGLKGL